jgi:hypothetical protein
MARAVLTSHPERRPAYEPLYDIDPRTGATLEVFWADWVLAKSFGVRSGWFWWTCHAGSLPQCPPSGPFPTSYRAYRDAMSGCERLFVK